MEVSSSSMNVASVTVSAMTQGLMVGRATAAVRLTMTGPGEGVTESEEAAVANEASGRKIYETEWSRVSCDSPHLRPMRLFFALSLLTRSNYEQGRTDATADHRGGCADL